MIAAAKENDSKEIEKLISEEFKYKGLTHEKIAGRLQNPNLRIFKKTLGKKTIGFVEIELLREAGCARINAISIATDERRKGHGKELLEFAIMFIWKSGFKKALLLVKRSNENAKSLYSKLGFSYARQHDKVIEGSPVEVWEKNLDREKEKYLN